MPRRVARKLALVGAVLVLSGCSTGPFHPTDLSERPLAVVYRGPAACDGCPEAVASLLTEHGGFNVEFIGPDEDRKLTAEDLRVANLYAQPGGFDDVGLAMKEMGSDATDAITAWVVERGGDYLGFCMGAYLAGSEPGMGLLTPGDTAGYAESEGSLVSGPDATIIPVDWNGEVRYQYAQDPAIIVESGVEGEQVLSRFTNGTVNALVRPVGKGAVGVVGTHPEAGPDWFTRELAEADIDGPDHAQALELVEALRDVG